MEIKDISYLGKDFGQFRNNLIEFTKQYFPQTYTDFNESSPGMLFIELAAYVGDVLSFYADTNLKESLLERASERGNVFDLARALGYMPKNAIPAHTTLSVYQLVPSIGSGSGVHLVKSVITCEMCGDDRVFKDGTCFRCHELIGRYS